MSETSYDRTNLEAIVAELEAVASAPSQQPAWRIKDACTDAVALIRATSVVYEDQGRATLASAIVLTGIATIGATVVGSWVAQAAAMLGGVG